MLKYILCIVIIILILADVIVYFDFKKFIKSHENELVEDNMKGLMSRVMTMAIISLLVGIIGLLLKFI